MGCKGTESNRMTCREEKMGCEGCAYNEKEDNLNDRESNKRE